MLLAEVTTCNTMAAKTIRVSEEVYERLQDWKREDESFGEAVDRLIDEYPDVYAGFGAWKGTDKPEAMREVHESMNASLDSENH